MAKSTRVAEQYTYYGNAFVDLHLRDGDSCRVNTNELFDEKKELFKYRSGQMYKTTPTDRRNIKLVLIRSRVWNRPSKPTPKSHRKMVDFELALYLALPYSFSRDEALIYAMEKVGMTHDEYDLAYPRQSDKIAVFTFPNLQNRRH